jgi:putative intracellular protease/amidase
MPAVAVLVGASPAAGARSEARLAAWLRSGGLRPVAVPPPALTWPDGCAALVLPGGDDPLRSRHAYMAAAERLWRAAEAAGLPVLAVCQGLEAACAIVAGRPWSRLRTRVDALRHAVALRPLPGAPTWLRSRCASGARVAADNHAWALTPARLAAEPRLAAAFEPLSVSVDRAGAAFVSTLASADGRALLTQWHPERPWARRLRGERADAWVPIGRDALALSAAVLRRFAAAVARAA